MRLIQRVGGKQTRLRADRLQIVDNGEALRDRSPVRLQHRHEPLRVAGAVGVAAMLAVQQVDWDPLIFDALQRQCDADPVAR
jgi:hypothetical protein